MPSIAEAVFQQFVPGGKKRRRGEDEDGIEMRRMGGGSIQNQFSNQTYPASMSNTTAWGNRQEGGLEARNLFTPKPLRRHYDSAVKRQRIDISSSVGSTFSNTTTLTSPSDTVHFTPYVYHEHSSESEIYTAQPQTPNELQPQAYLNPYSTTNPNLKSIPETTTKPKPTTKINLSPCHICHRKPSTRPEVDSYTNCEGCQKRTCWICVRECIGFVFPVDRNTNRTELEREAGKDGVGVGVVEVEIEEDGEGDGEMVLDYCSVDDGEERGDGNTDGKEGKEGKDERAWKDGKHRGIICSRCCVERGGEGEVWCLGCLKSEGGA